MNGLDNLDLDEVARRGRVFSEMFPGTAASDRWLAEFEAHHPQRDSLSRLATHGGTSDDREETIGGPTRTDR